MFFLVSTVSQNSISNILYVLVLPIEPNEIFPFYGFERRFAHSYQFVSSPATLFLRLLVVPIKRFERSHPTLRLPCP